MDKKSKIKAGLSFGITMTIFFIAEALLTHNLTSKRIILSIVLGIFCGALAGFLFGWLLGWFTRRFENSKLVAQSTKIDTETGEAILFETGANHFKGAEAVGGKLYLTNKRLVFKSHKFNIQNHELSIILSGIDKVERYKTLGLANNGLAVTTSDSQVQKFVVQQPGEWFKQLTEKNGLLQLKS